MNITVERDVDIRMPQQLAHCLGVESAFNASGGIGVTKQMKIGAANAAFFQNRLKAVLHGARLYGLVSSRKDITGAFVLFQNIQNKCGNRNISHRGFALGRSNDECRFFPCLIYREHAGAL